MAHLEALRKQIIPARSLSASPVAPKRQSQRVKNCTSTNKYILNSLAYGKLGHMLDECDNIGRENGILHMDISEEASVICNGYVFFEVTLLACHRPPIIILVEHTDPQAGGVPFLYVSKTSRLPTRTTFDWKSVKHDTNYVVLEEEDFRPGKYYIAVYGYRKGGNVESINFRLQITSGL